MLQKIFLTALVIHSTTIMSATSGTRASWRYVPLSAAGFMLASQIAASSPLVPFPVTCVALIGCAVVMVAPDDIKSLLTYSGERAVAHLEYTKTIAAPKINRALDAAEKYLEKKELSAHTATEWLVSKSYVRLYAPWRTIFKTFPEQSTMVDGLV